ncbi:hypothetical protein MRX96_053963 [Rhipicephalus microplus]
MHRYGTLDATINRLQRLDLDAWPSDDVIRKSHGDLDRMYTNFPDPATSHSYLEHLFATRRVLRTLLGSASYHVMMGIGSRGAREPQRLLRLRPFCERRVCVARRDAGADVLRSRHERHELQRHRGRLRPAADHGHGR